MDKRLEKTKNGKSSLENTEQSISKNIDEDSNNNIQ